MAGQPKKQNNSRNRTLGYFRDFQKEPMSLTRCFLTLSQGFFGAPKGNIYFTPFCRHPNFYSHCLVLASQSPKEQQALLIKLGYLRVSLPKNCSKSSCLRKGRGKEKIQDQKTNPEPIFTLTILFHSWSTKWGVPLGDLYKMRNDKDHLTSRP